jgi:hypothetical protein
MERNMGYYRKRKRLFEFAPQEILWIILQQVSLHYLWKAFDWTIGKLWARLRRISSSSQGSEPVWIEGDREKTRSFYFPIYQSTDFSMSHLAPGFNVHVRMPIPPRYVGVDDSDPFRLGEHLVFPRYWLEVQRRIRGIRYTRIGSQETAEL